MSLPKTDLFGRIRCGHLSAHYVDMEEIFAEPFVSMVRCLKADAGLIPDYKLQPEDREHTVQTYHGRNFARTWIVDGSRAVRLTRWDDGSLWYEADLYDYPLADVSLWVRGDGQEVEYDLSVGEKDVLVTAELKTKIRDLFIPKEPLL